MDEVERSEHTPNHHNRLENDAGEFLNIPNDVMKEESVHIVYRFILPMFCLLENHNRFSITFIFNVICVYTLGVALERLSLVLVLKRDLDVAMLVLDLCQRTNNVVNPRRVLPLYCLIKQSHIVIFRLQIYLTHVLRHS